MQSNQICALALCELVKSEVWFSVLGSGLSLFPLASLTPSTPRLAFLHGFNKLYCMSVELILSEQGEIFFSWLMLLDTH